MTQLMLCKNERPRSFLRKIPHYGVKEAVFLSTCSMGGSDPVPKCAHRRGSGISDSFGLAFYKAQEAAQQLLPRKARLSR
jgi:carbamoyl-phosphate synthase large subunit